ncbi:MAG: hypothetical protein ACI4BD_00335 [Paludibacteraceae bacterium]
MRRTRINSLYILFAFLLLSADVLAVDTQALADSLQARYVPFSAVWSPQVKVKQVRVNGTNVTVRTNGVLGGVVFSPAELTAMRRQVSLWVLGHGRGKVSIYSNKYELGELLPDRLQKRKGKYPHYDWTAPAQPPVSSDSSYVAGSSCIPPVLTPSPRAVQGSFALTGRRIALWASHGTYYNYARGGWIWQRATLWNTVEDLYSTEYARLVVSMLENAGATVVQPRGRLDDPQAWEVGASGMPRWTEGARYWLEHIGFADTVWNKYEGEDDYKADLQCRGLWVNYLTGGSRCNPSAEGSGMPVDVCLALHTDGYDSGNDTTIIGTLAIYTDHDEDGNKVFPNGVSRQVNRDLADYVQTQLVGDIRRTMAPDWTRRQLHNASYCEARYPLVPSLLLEILSHKNMADMRYGLDPQFRFVASRAIYKGLLRYLRGADAVVQPLPVHDVAIDYANGAWELSWLPTADSLEASAVPARYEVYRRTDGETEWHAVATTKTPHAKIAAERGVKTDYCVVAVNDGGQSMPSAIVSAYLSAEKGDTPPALIVDAFDEVYGPVWFADSLRAGIVPGTYAVEDRYSVAYIGDQWDFDRRSQWQDDDNCGWGMCYRNHQGSLTIGNTRDYAAQHGQVLAANDISYVSRSGRTLPADLSAYGMVDVITGKNKQPLADSTVAALGGYVENGGRLLVSGSYLGNSFASVGHYRLQAPRATRSGVIRWEQGDTLRLHLETLPNGRQLFAEAPEGLCPADMEATRLGLYEDMRVSIGVVRESALGGKALILGFPVEAVQEWQSLLQRLANQLIE